ncbi:hypothetical protein O181_073635 [Austropuccinia psidii MF-1]|uniref:Reverse transcriptase domain-containing protein n=1 Tax=Austropuccinia psidii MF-1 TaxID=1389203 RepID=A0A9Q3IC81_9BASI|nr:hypothetical protein [Austropuccinia psidii MF-1]
MYGIDLHNNKDRYLTIGDNKRQKFDFLPFKRQITVRKVAPINLELERFKSEQLNEADISLHLNDNKEHLGKIVKHEVEIILNIERPYPPLLRRPAIQAIPKSREALEIHIKEILDLGVIRKVGHNEEVEITTPVIVVPNAPTQISQAVYISTMDTLKSFPQNLVTPMARKYLRIIAHCGVYEDLRMPFAIKNATSHFQRMMNEILLEELSKGWLIIYNDNIIVCSSTLEEHMYRLSRVLTRIQFFNMKISLKKCHFGLKELKALGHVVSGLSLGIDKNKF